MGCCICVEESEIAIIQNCGKFSRVEKSGCALINCWCENKAGSLSTRVQQYEFDIETRTQDNVFVTIKLALRVKVAETCTEFPKPRVVKPLKGSPKAPQIELDEKKESGKVHKELDSTTLLYRAFYK